MKSKNVVLKLLVAAVFVFMTGCTNSTAQKKSVSDVDYSKTENWAYYETDADKYADVFLICPTVDTNEENNMSLDDTDTKAKFFGALNMERGIYDENARLYAPYYRQGAMQIYALDTQEREKYLELAYADVSKAFSYYLENCNDDRPIILAGFSQGADMCYRLMEEYFGDQKLSQRLIAVYAIGWPLTEEMTAKYPQLRAAQSADDLGTIISFDCEDESVTDSFITPKGTKALSINPLNWETDSTAASKELNSGACFTDYDANIKTETPALCGCYIDKDRGTLKVTDVAAADYPPYVPGLPDGAYHIYDYQFFFRNLQQNVSVRVNAYRSANLSAAA